jgi:hypothetical protein
MDKCLEEQQDITQGEINWYYSTLLIKEIQICVLKFFHEEKLLSEGSTAEFYQSLRNYASSIQIIEEIEGKETAVHSEI